MGDHISNKNKKNYKQYKINSLEHHLKYMRNKQLRDHIGIPLEWIKVQFQKFHSKLNLIGKALHLKIGENTKTVD